MSISTAAGERKGPLFKYPKESDEIMKKLTHDLVEQVGRFGPVRGNGSIPAVQWVLSGLFDRFPTLRIFFAENQIGWIPFFLQGADVRYDRHHRWAERLLGFKPLKRPPSEYIREHCFWGFQFDRVGVELRHKINVDRPDVGLRLSPPRIRLARVAEYHRQELRRRGRRKKKTKWSAATR